MNTASKRTTGSRAIVNPLSPAMFASEATLGKDRPWLLVRHLKPLNERLTRIAAGNLKRLAVFMPPRHGKSELMSKWFPAWYLGKYPDRRVILASYEADFAAEWGAKVRDILEEHGPRFFGVSVRKDQRAAHAWNIHGHDGGMRTAGMEGSITGKGADLFLFDDPVKNPSEAQSPTIRQRNWDMYCAAADTRLEPGGAMCLTMTPWNEDDLGGRILEAEHGLWDVLRMPALAEETEAAEPGQTAEVAGYARYYGLPDALGRQPGEPLWPQRYGAEFFERKRRQDPYWYDAMFQCRPRSREGGMFKRVWFTDHAVREAPEGSSRIRYWDKAGTDGGGCYSVGLLMARKGANYYIEDVVRGQWSAHERDREIKATAQRDFERLRSRVSFWGEQEPGSGGKQQAELFVQLLAGYDVHTETATGDKETRARAFASQAEAGNVFMVAGPWNKAFLDEITGFPNGKFKDQVDGASGAFNRLALGIIPGPAAAGGSPRGMEPVSSFFDGGGWR